MFQSFTVLSSPETGGPRVAELRARFDALGLDALIVPRADDFQGEYVPASAARLAWLTGFTGSAGAALVTRNQAFIFVDGRYTTQVRAQADMAVFKALDLIEFPPAAWIRSHATSGMRIGIDPWLHTSGDVERLERAANEAGASIVLLEANPIDTIWTDRPAEPRGLVSIQPWQRAGERSHEKLARLGKAIAEKKAEAFVMTDPSSIAWTFNIRGSDVPHTPHPLARAIVTADGRPSLFIHSEKLTIETNAYLTQLAELRDPADFPAALDALAKDTPRVLVDPTLTPFAITERLRAAGADLVKGEDPTRLPRAIKNKSELEGSALAHRVDGVAMVTFLAWLDAQRPGTIDEITVAKRLEATRSANGEAHQMPLKDVSFETISGAGPNGAIIHYRVNDETNRVLADGELFLLDSGGQYVDGTTDITRTVAIGTPTAEMKRFFTLVLKGMIAISTARFPEGTRGVDIDAFARRALWMAGADYGHGTGHGVGAYLSVHEGPQSISKRGMQVLLPGMILSNEPGYYREGAFGIRIENLIVVREPEDIAGGDRPMLGFDTLTLCPIDRRLVDAALLDEGELDWLNTYHDRVRTELRPLVSDPAVADWLETATRPIRRQSS